MMRWNYAPRKSSVCFNFHSSRILCVTSVSEAKIQLQLYWTTCGALYFRKGVGQGLRWVQGNSTWNWPHLHLSSSFLRTWWAKQTCPAILVHIFFLPVTSVLIPILQTQLYSWHTKILHSATVIFLGHNQLSEGWCHYEWHRFVDGWSHFLKIAPYRVCIRFFSVSRQAWQKIIKLL